MAARGLGRGLDSLIPVSVAEDKVIESEAKKDGKETLVKISKIEPNKKQPRKNFDEEKIEELAESIKQHGLIEPILVQDRGDHYEIIAGERRWRASLKAGLKEIPVLIRNYSEQEIVEISLIENIQRQDLDPIEEAMAYKRLIDEFKMSQEEVAKRVSKNRTTITNSIRLLKLSDKVQEMVINRELSEGQARALISIEDKKKQEALAEKIVKEQLTVRAVEKLIRDENKPKKEKVADNKELDVFYQNIAEKLKVKLGTKVSVTGKGDGAGKIEIEFYSTDDIDRIISML